jgi:ParB-like chromosome segregation protein Spo0J
MTLFAHKVTTSFLVNELDGRRFYQGSSRNRRTAMNFENRPTHSLRPYAGNARTHSPKQIKQIARSIDRFGFSNPVLVDDDDQIIAGHGRVEAAKLLNMKTVPTVHLSHLSESEKKAYILADNRLAEKAGWEASNGTGRPIAATSEALQRSRRACTRRSRCVRQRA